jgi:8-oxo-dGTP pyrophosphatase MutT (NUDIX family)
MPELPPELDAAVEQLWRAACARAEAGGAGRLFNGRVFSADRLGPHEITGHMTEFRRIVAQMDDPAMYAALGLRPFAVCGVLRCAGGVVIGRRHRDAVYQPGMWQLPPAGSVDAGALRPDGRLDFVGALMAELAEELGLQPAQVDTPRPLCIVEHPGSHVCDFGLALNTGLDADAVLAAHRSSGNTEYDPLLVVPDADMPGFVEDAGRLLVPPAREFLKRLGLLPA